MGFFRLLGLRRARLVVRGSLASSYEPDWADAKKAACKRPLIKALSLISVSDIVRVAVAANGQVGLVPFFLGGAARVGLEGGLIGKLHYENS